MLILSLVDNYFPTYQPSQQPTNPYYIYLLTIYMLILTIVDTFFPTYQPY
jgi:hypothetical protein